MTSDSATKDAKRAAANAKHVSGGTGSVPGRLLVAAACGLLFGVSINRSGVYNATVLRNQFDFSDNTMLVIFLTATGTSILTLSFMKAIPALRGMAEFTGDAYRALVGVPATALGAAILGSGMVVGGACPGTVWAQLGSGNVQALVTLAGGMAGALGYALVFPALKRFVQAYPIAASKASVADLAPAKRPLVGFGMALAMAGMVYGVSTLMPTSAPSLTRSLSKAMNPAALLAERRWSPVFGGLVIGALQLPLVMALRKNVGSASSFVTLVSKLVPGACNLEVLNQKMHGMKNWWQVTYMISAAVGAAMSVMLTASAAGAAPVWYTGSDVTLGQAFAGGALVVTGARLAGGCTSGHGISGAGHLMIRSFVAVAAMFAGGIVTKALLF